jgi:peptidoglycan hydrolase CwlO-like protein
MDTTTTSSSSSSGQSKATDKTVEELRAFYEHNHKKVSEADARLEAMQQQLNNLQKSHDNKATAAEAASAATMHVTAAFLNADVQKEASKTAAVDTAAAPALRSATSTASTTRR